MLTTISVACSAISFRNRTASSFFQRSERNARRFPGCSANLPALGKARYQLSMAELTRRSALALLLSAGILACPRTALAEDLPTIGQPSGRPRISIDRLTFPPVAGSEGYVRHLTSVLRREARRVDWGAGRNNRIPLRFTVEKLVLVAKGSALEVRCSARGELPGGRRARSRLVYGGDPKQAQKLVERVLEIVARGVVGRLAEMERERRTG